MSFFTYRYTPRMHPTKWIDKQLLFYKTMKYPIPDCEEYFYYKKKTDKISEEKHQNWTFSWQNKSKLIQEYINHINKYWNIYKSIPFIKDIYLCNSLTFNAINKKSDIDIVIISKPWKLRRTRFRSVLFFWILWLKRNSSDYTKKFCLSFYIDNSVLNIKNIKEKWEDVYLCYWLAHCVKLYQEQENDDFYKQNNRISDILPNFEQKQKINIWNEFFTWKSTFKKALEFLLDNKIWNFFQNIIKYLRLPILIYKKNKLWKKWEKIIISDKMLKFYNDKRYIYNMLFRKGEN